MAENDVIICKTVRKHLSTIVTDKFAILVPIVSQLLKYWSQNIQNETPEHGKQLDNQMLAWW